MPILRRYDDAKALGKVVNDAKQRINELKTQIEQRRVQRAMAGTPDSESDPEEDQAKAAIEADKARYKTAFGRLRELKQEIEQLQLMLEQSRTRLQKDFQQWVAVMTRYQQQQQQQQGGGGGAAMRHSGQQPLAAAASSNGGSPHANRGSVISSTVGAGYSSHASPTAPGSQWQPPGDSPGRNMLSIARGQGAAPHTNGSALYTPMQSPEKPAGPSRQPIAMHSPTAYGTASPGHSQKGSPTHSSGAGMGAFANRSPAHAGSSARSSLQLVGGGGGGGSMSTALRTSNGGLSQPSALHSSAAGSPIGPSRQAWAAAGSPTGGKNGHGPPLNQSLAQLRQSANGGGHSSTSGSASLSASVAELMQTVDASVLEAAKPYLTGNVEADADIIKFYEARAKLLQNMSTGA